jgi:hypothetical protein
VLEQGVALAALPFVRSCPLVHSPVDSKPDLVDVAGHMVQPLVSPLGHQCFTVLVYKLQGLSARHQVHSYILALNMTLIVFTPVTTGISSKNEIILPISATALYLSIDLAYKVSNN